MEQAAQIIGTEQLERHLIAIAINSFERFGDVFRGHQQAVQTARAERLQNFFFDAGRGECGKHLAQMVRALHNLHQAIAQRLNQEEPVG